MELHYWLVLGEIQYGATFVLSYATNSQSNLFHSIPISSNGFAIDERGRMKAPTQFCLRTIYLLYKNLRFWFSYWALCDF